MRIRRPDRLFRRRVWPASFAGVLASFVVSCATTARFEDRKSCEKVAQRDFEQCTDVELHGNLYQPSPLSNDQADPSQFRNPPLLNRSSCNQAYRRQLQECSELPTKPSLDEPNPEIPLPSSTE